MPSPLAIDKEQVRSTYLATGSLTETAKLHGVKDATIRQWAKRYHWETGTQVQKLLQKAEQIVELKRENGHRDVPSVSRSADALAQHLENSAHTFKTNMAGALARSSQALCEMDSFTALDNSRRMVDLATAASKVFPSMGDTAQLSVNVLGLSLDSMMAVRPSVVEV
jgi:transposase-like protein